VLACAYRKRNEQELSRTGGETEMSAMIKEVPLICPACELYQMRAARNMRARCPACGFALSGEMLKTLFEILALPEALETHACEECGHPQMRHLPDGVYYCPACHAEVTPVVNWAPGRVEEM
jgi:ribosomal protein L37AE/L43A